MKGRAQTEVAGSAGWSRRMTAVFVAAAFVALASTVAYQNAITIPHLKSGASPSLAQVYGPTFSLTADKPGAWTLQVSIHPTDGFLLDFEFNPTYLFKFIFLLAAGCLLASLASDEGFRRKGEPRAALAVPQGVVQRPGSYSLVLLGAYPGAADPASGPVRNSVVQPLTFTILFLQ